MPQIVLFTSIKAPQEICFRLSLSVELHQLSTEKTGEHIVDGVRKGIMGLGDTVTWKARHFGIWQTLTTKITAHESSHYFVDEMTKGAFKSLRHEHYFVEAAEETVMKDIFNFESPFGIMGSLFNFFVLEKYMRNFLIERNQVIKKIAESGRWGKFV